ncbi:hypothetical protein FIBSPDRAFT_937869 [Athelia psychrophila]|uniref:Uncharacterized protein n=1 Tax=Athelia psychrophila TaxID=1759441 RepID=A0A165ZNK5_9AGAM|nr:hypothetical protein FIBSPDRAFT_937869 [Fibularhizoctonia sp. CBS 109695]
MAFLSWDLLRSARLWTLIAIVSWIIPLVSIFTPRSLGVRSNTDSIDATCTVPSVELQNTEALFQTGVFVDKADRYDDGAPNLPTSNPCHSSNCTYTISDRAPAAQCNQTVPDSSAFWLGALDIYWNAKPSGATWDPTNSGIRGQIAIEYNSEENIQQANGVGTSFACALFNTTYQIEVQWSGDSSTACINSIEYGGVYLFGAMPGEFSALNTAKDRETTNFEAIKNTIYSQMNESLVLLQHAFYFTTPDSVDVIYTSLAANNSIQEGLEWVSDLVTAVEQVFQNTTHSLLAFDFGTTADVSCLLTKSGLVFSYNPQMLWLAYGINLAVSVLCLAAGAIAAKGNQFGGDAGFGAFLDSTRHSELNVQDIDETAKLRYGRLSSHGEQWGFMVGG